MVGMTDKLNKIDDLQRRIDELKHDVHTEIRESVTADDVMDESDKKGLSAAYELIMTPIVCGGMGLGLDYLFSTKPVFFISLAFLGVCAGFWRLYRVSNNIQTPLDLKRLQDAKKKGMNSQLSENNTEES